MTLNIQIFQKFLSGERICLNSFRRFGDINTYLDCKLVRIYYVHNYKPKKQTPIDNFISDLQISCDDEKQLIESVISFINDYPNFWEFRETMEFKILNQC